MSDMPQSPLRSPRWHELQRSLAESFGAANAKVIADAIAKTKAPACAGGNWLARVRRDSSALHQLPHN
jgi:hypothetical protein